MIFAASALSAHLLAQSPQQEVDPAPVCTAMNLEVSLHAYRAPEDLQVIALNYHNTGGEACTLREFRKQSGYPSYFPGRNPYPPTVLDSNGWVHSSFRWHTEQAAGGRACEDQTVRYFLLGTPAGSLWVTSPTLLPRICSKIEDDTNYHPGLFVADWPARENAPNITTPPAVTVAKQNYFENERVRFHLTLADRPPTEHTCPVILETDRNEQGEMRIDEVLSPTDPHVPNIPGPFNPAEIPYYSCHHSAFPVRGNEYEFNVYLGGGAVWTGMGKHTFRFIQLAGFGEDGEYIQEPADPLTLNARSAVDIPRTWGATEKGVRVDLMLDKFSYRLGEEIPLHLATEDVAAPFPVYDRPFVHAMGAVGFGAVLSGSLHVILEDVNGPIKPKDVADMAAGSFRSRPCPEAYRAGVPVPEEAQLSSLGLLPDHAGAFRIYVTWSPYTSANETCEDLTSDAARSAVHEPIAPFVTVSSAPLMIRVSENGDDPESTLNQ
jgi:hypothetical protein